MLRCFAGVGRRLYSQCISFILQNNSCAPTSARNMFKDADCIIEKNSERCSVMPTSSRVWPVAPWLILVALPFMPTWCYLNRGFTQWFHWNAIFFCLTQNEFHAKLVALQGLTVNLGWYASLAFDWHRHNRFGHILLWNMPEVMTRYIFDQDQQVMYNKTSFFVRLLAHCLDTLGHPVLAYYFWRRSFRNSTSICRDVSWSVLFAACLLSRGWSLLHTWYNYREISLFYFGYEVYTILDSDKRNLMGYWLPAYLAEVAVFLWLAVGKVYLNNFVRVSRPKRMPPKSLADVPPMLLSSTVSDAASDEE